MKTIPMKPNKIAPSILSADFANLGAAVKMLESAGAAYAHIDVMDGHFVPNLTFGAGVVAAIRPHSQLFFDCHLMVEHPETYIDSFAKAGADSLSVHIEATKEPRKLLQSIKEAGMQASIVIKPKTAVAEIENVLDLVDMVLVMTVEPGFGGQAFMPAMMEKVRQLAELREKQALNYDIEVDGGIDDQTISLAKAAGANVFVAGSYVFKGIPAEQIHKLKAQLS